MNGLSGKNQMWLQAVTHKPTDSIKVVEVEVKLIELETQLKQANEWISVEDKLPEKKW